MAVGFASVEKIVKVKSMSVTFNEDELVTLMVILNRIGGHPSRSCRKHAQSIADAIYTALDGNINHDKYNAFKETVSEENRAIYFEDME